MLTQDTQMNALQDEAWVARTALFRQGQAFREEVARHRWYESERAGCVIGWDRATADYLLRMSLRRAA